MVDELYWKTFYRTKILKEAPPSQFAAFVATELYTEHKIGNNIIIDYGCGTGRDSIFFANYSKKVISVDQVKHEVFCNVNERVVFCYPNELENIVDEMQHDKSHRIVIYARFFLHAINPEEQREFFRSAEKITKTGDLMYFEFRTKLDKDLRKVTGKHYRRYQESNDVVQQLSEHNFQVKYVVEGVGYAKYGYDDACVARTVFEKK